jgi:hypothetical protein
MQMRRRARSHRWRRLRRCCCSWAVTRARGGGGRLLWRHAACEARCALFACQFYCSIGAVLQTAMAASWAACSAGAHSSRIPHTPAARSSGATHDLQNKNSKGAVPPYSRLRYAQRRSLQEREIPVQRTRLNATSVLLL